MYEIEREISYGGIHLFWTNDEKGKNPQEMALHKLAVKQNIIPFSYEKVIVNLKLFSFCFEKKDECTHYFHRSCTYLIQIDKRRAPPPTRFKLSIAYSRRQMLLLPVQQVNNTLPKALWVTLGDFGNYIDRNEFAIHNR